ncbi:serine hydrolase domain-containing protein [Sphingosinicella rhizophila]|uniref:Serine hydrolase domain-containing protein n=1 Tax=Sphingosinicella rhizophila TaxID=3050082 RepID=A0ABU3Q5H8_9SPHN|nr:serine hydrolase domain-containing protein [Sphingosinicella sp. GR2756]MDT9598664.1 serine hydrolase domain-containing protein [Sphingosinicella sp. GR2756]
MKIEHAARAAVAGLALIAAASASAQGKAPAGFDAAWKDVARIFHDSAKSEGTVAASLYFVQEGRVARAEYHGVTDLDGGRPVDASAIYHWASITKTLTGVALMQLRDRGLINLDDPIVKYLPEVRKVHNPFGPMDKITLRHLLSHSSGLRASTFPWRDHEKEWQPHEPADWSQVEAMMPYSEIAFEPGSRCSYSNPGISMLGRVIEIVTGDSFESYVTKNILMPLSMSRSYFDNTPYFLVPDKTNNYFIRDGKAEPQGRELDTGATVANGGWNSTLDDMVRWLNFWNGTGDARNYDLVLSRKTLAEMQQPRCSIAAGDDLDQKMGFTFFTINYPLKSGGVAHYVGHTGGQKAYNDYVYIDPVSKTAVIFANNTRNLSVKGNASLYRKTREAVFERIFPLFDGKAAK